MKYSGEEWQKEIIAKDMLEAVCCLSYLANLLYPDEISSQSRHDLLFKEGGEFVKKLNYALQKRIRRLEEFKVLVNMKDKKCLIKTETTPPVSCDLLPTVLLTKEKESGSTNTSTNTTDSSDTQNTKDTL